MDPAPEVPVAQVEEGLCMVQCVTSGILVLVHMGKTASAGMCVRLVPSLVSSGSNIKPPLMIVQGPNLGYHRNSHQLVL